MKRIRNAGMLSIVCLCVLAALLLAACSKTEPSAPAGESAAPQRVSTDIDFTTSSFKHITNGNITDDDTLPYNIDAITGATLTVEGPAVQTSIPLSVRELENRNDGLCRGVYEDSSGRRLYEGLDLYYMLNDMVEGDNGIILTDTAYKVQLKNSNRATISEFTLEDVVRAHEDGRPILLAYGVGTEDGETIVPFVFDAANEGEHSLGYVDALKNDDGCIRLVYDAGSYGANTYDTFSNVAYVYVCEESEPGFKHTDSDPETFGASRYTDYIVTFRGSALGCEYDLTTRELESLVVFNDDGTLTGGGIGYTDYYSLANTTYWYVNEYEGLDLYKLLLYLGMQDADTMGLKAARTTLISFIAADGVASNETFSVDTLSYPDAFGFYNKNAADIGDGSYVSTNADLVKTGYPVLMAYGVNNYPYTVSKTDPAYVSGLANSGGPFRVVFGKTQYSHANGSNQVQLLSEVIVGEDVLYNTHAYTDNSAHKKLAGEAVAITVNGDDGQALISRELTVGELEAIVYGENVAGNVKKAARVKDSFEVSDGSEYKTDIYEGVDLNYFLMDYLGLPGTNGTVNFSDGKNELTISLEELFQSGYNSQLGRDGLSSMIAFAKNGAPLVKDSMSVGYISELALNPFLDSDPASYEVDNAGGPLQIIIPSTEPGKCDARSLSGITSITVDLIPDSYAHVNAPYSDSQAETIRFYGEGLENEAVFTVGELESRQTKTQTLDFSILGENGELTEARYRGLSIYELFAEIGIANNAGDVTVYSADGSSKEFSLSLLRRSFENLASPDKSEVCALLAYGVGDIDAERMDGTPLVASASALGYDDAAGNSGGPLRLIIPQENEQSDNAALFIDGVTAVEVSANDVDTWSHSMSDVYEEFLDDTLTLVIKNDANEWTHDFTVAQLETLEDIIVRDDYSVLDVGTCEGVDIWKFIQRVASGVKGIDDPVAITAYASDGYKNDLLSVFYKEGFTRGVEDENGNRRTLIICYAINGYPLVDSESHEGYTGLAGNGAGPLRVIAETNQGASVKYCTKLVVTLPGSEPIDITVDDAIFGD